MKTSALSKVGAHFEALGANWLEQVLAIEKTAYSHPWTSGNFHDALKSGYWAHVLLDQQQELLGYVVAMPGVEETHLLNLTVAPNYQRQGYARTLLDRLSVRSVERGAKTLWLEVRAGNHRALSVYEAHGFERVGARRHYYPAAGAKREDAVVMRRDLEGLA